MSILIVFFAGILLIAAGVGLLRSLEAVVSRRKGANRVFVRWAVLKAGWILLLLGGLANCGFVVAVAGDLLDDHVLPFDEPVAIVSRIYMGHLLCLVPIVGTLFLCSGRALADADDRRFFRYLDGLSTIAWELILFGGLTIAASIFHEHCIGLMLVILLASAPIRLSRYRAQQDALLWILAIAAHKQMPLTPGIEAFADQSRGRFRRRLLLLVDALNAGERLPAALQRVRGVLPRSAVVEANVGWESGVLGDSLRAVVAARSAQQPFWFSLTGRLGYLALLALFEISTFSYISYYIVPQIERIFTEYGVKLPVLTVFVIEVGRPLVSLGLSPVLASLSLVFLAFLLLLYFGWLDVDIPPLNRIFRHRDRAVVLRALASAVEGRRPLARGIEVLAERPSKRWVRARLGRVLRALDQGASGWQCLSSEGFFSKSDAAVLEAAERAGNLAWAIRELAERVERRFAYRSQAWLQIAFPLVIVGVGLLVFVLATAFFLPIVTLIAELSA